MVKMLGNTAALKLSSGCTTAAWRCMQQALSAGICTSSAACSSSNITESTNWAPRSIWCVGRNYADHAKELGNAVPTTPMIFLKAGATVVQNGNEAILPSWSSNVQHEVELAIELGPDLKPARGAVALDLTARDVQEHVKAHGLPWAQAKSFPCSTPLGTPFPLAGLDLQDLQLRLLVNGKPRQQGSTKDMVFTVARLVEYVSQMYPVSPGDVILTGTPRGVAALQSGDLCEAQVLAGGKVLSTGSWTAVRKN